MADQRIAVIGGTVWGNRGAEAMLETVIGRIRAARPDARFCLFSYYPKRDRGLVSDPAITVFDARPIDLVSRLFPGALWAWLWSLIGVRLPAWALPRGVAALRECALLVDVAGVAFSDGRTIFLPFNVLCLWPAMLLGVPVCKGSQALGPFRDPLNRMAARIFLTRCRFIFGRGGETMGHLATLGLTDEITAEAPDLAFAHRAEFALSRENDDRRDELLERLRAARAAGDGVICFSPSSLVARKCRAEGVDYAATLAAMAHLALARGYAILVAPTAMRESAALGPRNNDLTVVGPLVEAIGPARFEGRVHWVDWDMNYAGVRALMAEADAAVVSRFHALVAALSLGRPTLALGWGHKYTELMAHFGMADWSVDFAGLDAEALSGRLARLIDEHQALSATIAAFLPGVEARTVGQFDRILSVLN